MPVESNPSAILAQAIELANSLPADPGAYADLPLRKRRVLRSGIELAVKKLNAISEALDSAQQPKHVFDPTSPQVIGEIVAKTLLLQDREPLKSVTKLPFYGAGVYAIYYRGSFGPYEPITGLDIPIYVGKADPAEMHASTASAQGTRLHTRLRDHERSITHATNLNLDDFDCRYLVVRSAWIETAENLLINWFKPVWNNEMKVCYGFGKHGDSAGTRRNERSPWDTIHPGRPWATNDQNTPNKRTAADIISDIAAHFETHPPKNSE